MFPWVVGIIPMVTNHGIAPRNMLEAKSMWSEGPISKSDESPDWTFRAGVESERRCQGVEVWRCRIGIGAEVQREQKCGGRNQREVEVWNWSFRVSEQSSG